MNSDTNDDKFDWQALHRSFDRYVSERSRLWISIAKQVPGANQHDAENGCQTAIKKLWNKIKQSVEPGDVDIPSILLRALKPKKEGDKLDPEGWMAKVIHNAVVDEIRTMYKVRRSSVKPGEKLVQGNTEKEQDEKSRRRVVQMTEEHLSAIEATQPDSSHEWSEAQLVFIENARKWLTEDKLIALDAQLRLNPPDVTWELLAAEIGDTESALKKRASRAKRILKTKLALLGYTTCSSI